MERIQMICAIKAQAKPGRHHVKAEYSGAYSDPKFDQSLKQEHWRLYFTMIKAILQN